jgi:lipoprotein-releasing system permease protein
MPLPLFIARRYFFAKKRHSAINIVSAISAGGIALSTLALVCILSGFNGMRDLIAGLYSTFDAEIEVTPTRDKYVDAAHPALQRLRSVEDVDVVAETFEENALILYLGNPLVVTVKGVDDNFRRLNGLDSIVYDLSNAHMPLPPLTSAGVDYAVPGYGLAARMGIDFGHIEICAPRGGERINMMNPAESFHVEEVFSSACYFQVNQKRYDESLLLTSLDFARRLFEKPGQLTALCLRLRPGADVGAVKERIRQIVGPDFAVRDRLEQHEDFYKIQEIEKLVAFVFLTFILLMACFNLIGSVSMLIIDKRDDLATLRALGMDDRRVARVFLAESRLIALAGAVAGIVGGLVLCWLQQHYGLIRLGSGEGSFIVDAYPISVRWQDILLIFVTVIAVSFATVWWPVRSLCRHL